MKELQQDTHKREKNGVKNQKKRGSGDGGGGGGCVCVKKANLKLSNDILLLTKVFFYYQRNLKNLCPYKYNTGSCMPKIVLVYWTKKVLMCF